MAVKLNPTTINQMLDQITQERVDQIKALAQEMIEYVDVLYTDGGEDNPTLNKISDKIDFLCQENDMEQSGAALLMVSLLIQQSDSEYNHGYNAGFDAGQM